MIQADKIGRWERTAITWARKVCALLQREHGKATTEEQRWLVGYSAANVLTGVLDDLTLLVSFLPEDLIEESEAVAVKLARKLRNHRLALQMEKTEGRTAEEIAVFRAKAAELRSDN